jgi:hypothetical protein
MKLQKTRKALIVAATGAAIITVGTPVLAFSIGDTLAEFVATQQGEVFGVPTSKIAGFIKNGKMNMNTVFNDIQKQAYDWVKASSGNVLVKTAGDQKADLDQDKNEVSHQENTESTASNAKFLKDNAQRVQQTVSENETASESSLEGADKANKLAAVSISTSQQLTKATLDLAVSQQNQNSIEIERGQKERTERLKSQIDSSFAQNEYQRLQVVAHRRFYKNRSGEMVDSKTDSTTKVFLR